MCHVGSVFTVHRGLMEVRRGEYSIYYGMELGSKRVSSWRGVLLTKGSHSKVNGSCEWVSHWACEVVGSVKV